MSKHKPPTDSELTEWEKYGSYAGHDAVQRMIVEIRKMRAEDIGFLQAFDELKKNAEALLNSHAELRKVNDGLVETVVDLRKAFKEYGQHKVICSQTFPPDEEPCDCGFDKELKT